MAQIKKLKENGATIYPATITQAVVDPETGKNITEIFASKNAATSSSLGLIKGGPDIVVGGDGSVTVNNRIIPKMYKMGVNTNYKLFSIKGGTDKGSIVFSILSPVLSSGRGYAKYIIHRSYEGTTVKNWYPRCLYATDSSMYNRIKLVRTGDAAFDVYYQSNTGNDYCTFILDETTSTEVEIVAAGVSSIPEDIYKESEYASVYLGEIHGTLKGSSDSSKAIIARTETDIDSDIFEIPGMYVAPISSIYINGTDTPLYGNSIIITIGNENQAGYIEQIVIASIDDETKIFRRSWDLTTEAFEFTSLLPDIATSRTAGLVKSGNHITVSDDGTVTVTNSQKATNDSAGNNIANTYQNKTKPIPFNNSSDAINIDHYPQNNYGTIAIWFNQAEADGNPPGQEGIVYQTKYRSMLGESGDPYVDCLTQLYVGSGGVKHRTVIDYDDAAKFDGVAWSESGNSPQVIPVYVYQAAGYIDLTGLSLNDIDTSKPIYVKDTYGGDSGLIPLSCTKTGSTLYITFTYMDSDYAAPVIAYKKLSATDFGKHVNLSFKEL